ncbi:MAG: hypothetical protein ACTSVZ_11860 [Promethearchaeota archaeon]
MEDQIIANSSSSHEAENENYNENKLEPKNMRSIKINHVCLSIVVLVFSIKYNFIFPVFFGIFFIVSLIRGDSESDEDISFVSYVWKNTRGIITVCMGIFGVFTILWIWVNVTPYLTLLVIAMIAGGVQFHRKSSKGQEAELNKLRELRRYDPIEY